MNFSRLTIYYIVLLVFMNIGCSSNSSKAGRETTGKVSGTADSISTAVITDNKTVNPEINFYFENSASMNGYLSGDNLIETMMRIVGNIDDKKLNSYFVNTEEHKRNNILSDIKKKNTKIGNTGSSDHKFIFKNAIKHATSNNLSIVVTDGIYSVNGEKSQFVSIEIENAFKKALRDNKIETVVLKFSSNFNGYYYSESNPKGKKAIKINQERPYYILLFGNKLTIDKALKEIVITDQLPGFKQKAHFFINKNNSSHYSVLTMGEELHGTVTPSDKHIKTELHNINVEKFSSGGFLSSTPKEDNYIKFGIAVNFSNFPLPNTYLTDTSNYKVSEVTGYKVVKVKTISELSKSSKTYRKIDKLKNEYTHLIVVKATTNLYGNLDIYLLNHLPAWIKETGMENDSNILNNTKQTFAFDYLIKGISKAYESINESNEYLEIKIKTKIL